MGFVELGTRNYAEGCETSPVGYLEGIWADPDVRRAGLARELAERVLAWAAEHGYRDFGSDCALGNEISYAFHRAIGFEETDRIICFRREVPR